MNEIRKDEYDICFVIKCYNLREIKYEMQFCFYLDFIFDFPFSFCVRKKSHMETLLFLVLSKHESDRFSNLWICLCLSYIISQGLET